jgi:glycosyltransferase involved in cell wall biosynthesis
MRVAIFTDNNFEKVNGVTTTLRAVLRYAPDGIEPRIYTASNRAADDRDYLALRSIGAPIPFYGEMHMYLPRVREYLRRAREERVDVVHLTTPGPVGLAAMRVARLLRLPMVGSFHTDLAAYTGILSGSPRLERLMGAYMRWPYGRCARLLVPSEDARRLLEGSNANTGRAAVWRRGVDSAHFHQARRSEDVRRRWRVSRRCPAVLYVGRVSREKGLDLLPGLQQCLHASGLAHRLVIVGSGPMLPELQARMPDAVFTGSLDREAVATAFASADAFVFPSRTDTAANVVLEAQASGLPVLVSDAGGPKENLTEGTTGFVVSGSAPHAWARALVPLLENESLRGEMSRAARRYAESRTWQQALETLYRTYGELATSVAASAAVPALLPRGISLS